MLEGGQVNSGGDLQSGLLHMPRDQFAKVGRVGHLGNHELVYIVGERVPDLVDLGARRGSRLIGQP